MKELICPVCKAVKQVKMIEGEPCVECAEGQGNGIGTMDYLCEGWASLYRSIGFPCSGHAGSFGIPWEFCPNLIETVYMTDDRSYAPRFLLPKRELTAHYLKAIESVVNAERALSTLSPDRFLACAEIPGEDEKRRMIRMKWTCRLISNLGCMSHDLLVYRVVMKERVSWHETIGLRVPFGNGIPIEGAPEWWDKVVKGSEKYSQFIFDPFC